MDLKMNLLRPVHTSMMPLAVCAAMLLSFGGVDGQPVTCSENEQCNLEHFCDSSAKICRSCIRCEELKREPPPHLSAGACIKSVSDCGGCLKGLVVNLLGDVSTECVLPASQAEGAVLPTYVWVLIALALLCFVLIIVVVVYVLRNKETIKMISWTERQYSEPPPPYNPCYKAVRPESPTPRAPSDPELDYPANNNANEDAAFIKRNPFPDRRSTVEKEGNQAARVFKPPAYMYSDQPPSADPPTVTELSDTFENPMLHDEDTVESVWSPHVAEEVTENPTTNGNVAVAVAGRPAKKLCLSQDSKNNKNREASASSGENSSSSGAFSCSPSPTQSKPAFVINVVQINNK